MSLTYIDVHRRGFLTSLFALSEKYEYLMSFVDEIWGFWPDFTELISILNLLPPDIKYAYSILFSMHFLWYWQKN